MSSLRGTNFLIICLDFSDNSFDFAENCLGVFMRFGICDFEGGFVDDCGGFSCFGGGRS